MLHSVRSAAMIVLAALASGFVLSMLIITANELTVQSRRVEEFLSPEETLALVWHPNQDMIDQWTWVLPEVDWDGVLQNDPEAIAFLGTGSSLQGLALFTRKDTSPVPSFALSGSLLDHDPFYIYVTDDSLEPWIGFQEPSLLRYPAYKRLAEQHVPDESWLYASTTIASFPEHVLERMFVGLALHDTTHISLQSKEDRMLIHSLGLPFAQGVHITDAVTVTASGTIAQMHAFHAMELAHAALHVLSSGIREQFVSVLQATIREYAGSDVSAQYDLLPLLQSPSRFSLYTNSSGTTLFDLSGDIVDIQDFEKTRERIHDSFTKERKGVAVDSYIFDGRFPSTIVRTAATEEKEDSHFDSDAYAVRHSTDDNSRHLLSGMSTTEYLISNDPELALFNQSLDVVHLPKMTALTTAVSVAGGVLHPVQLIEQIGAYIDVEEKPLYIFSDADRQYAWSLFQEQNMRTLIVEAGE